ncbi:MAG: glycosyltransferase [Oscillospiraceae bacterium]|nr:glycosyltransferase [Oscillospiraceae bacterium]
MKPSILILANKDLSRNTRIERQVRALRSVDWEVCVHCLAPPEESLYPEVYVAVPSGPFSWIGPLREKLFRLLSRPRPLQPVLPDCHPNKYEQKKPLVARACFPLSYLLGSWSFLFSVWRSKRQEKYDVIQAHDHFTIRAASFLARKSGAQLAYDAVELPYAITEIADQALLQPLARGLLKRERSLLNNARIFTVSPGLAAAIKQNYRLPEPFVVRNCSLSVPRSHLGIRNTLGLASSEKLIIYLNSILPDRGVRTILRAAESMPAHIHFAFLGPKPNSDYFNEIKALCQSPTLVGRVHFPAQVKACDLSRYISSADIGVIATKGTDRNLRHCLPNRLFEMIMAGLPLVVSDIPDLTELIAQFNLGLSFEQDNPAALQRSLEKMLEDATREAFAKNALEASLTLCWEKEGQHYVSELNKLLP